ncbi:hypothetical protein LMG7053_06167 [Achromobacter ruhlandii]|uniref:Uncharacterized protein n=1 Tax=Achromobacter ruhlandii TaxID=72557 RepID=A0ABM8M6R8_9BURK|nr:hypothetical protein [Achromobacter ruhlandii]CAB3960117.1 hypothetical protein LMG7053_06167 [Achromobacter ruhlandii]
MSKNISDLRDAMFETIQALKDGKITVEQAKAMSDIGQVIINSAKVEVDYIRANNGGESSFIDAVGNDNLPPGITGVTRHRLVG